MEGDGSPAEKLPKKGSQPVRVYPRYVRVRQGSEIRYQVKLLRPPTRGKGVTIHVCVVTTKCGVTVEPTQVLITASDWRLPREICVTSDLNAEIRTIQIYHKIHETYDDIYSSQTIIPSVFVSVLQKEATFLFAFGCGLDGRLGTSDEQNVNLPTPFSHRWLHPMQIACGRAHCAMIDVNSNVFCLGSNDHAQLGQGDGNLESSRIPLRITSMGTASVLQVACGANHTMCMTSDGKLFSWGDNTYGQLGQGAATAKPYGTPGRIEKVVNVRNLFCGGNQSFVVTMDNNVLAAGSNIAGQLGFGDRVDRAAFERLPFFRKLASASLGSSSRDNSSSTFVEVELACGLYHTLAVRGRRVYAWGNGDDGRLGHGNLETYLEPTPIAALVDVSIASVVCGGSHSGALATNGEVYSWGNGHYGQLGLGSTKNRRLPAKVRLLANKQVVQLSFGEWHSMALCEDGTLYAWGFGEEGRLGLPDDPKQKTARLALLPTIVSSLSGTGATLVRCGSAHTFVVSVLESRRPHLAKLHRKTSKMEVYKEQDRLAKAERQKIKELQQKIIKEEEDERSSLIARATAALEAEEKAKAKARRALQQSRRRLQHAWRQREDTWGSFEREEPPPSWKERPMTSRTSIRNAFHQEMREIKDMKEVTTPMTARQPRQSQSARTFVSPRLRRLHAHVVRVSEAGLAITRTHSMLHTGDTADEIEDEVHAATEHLLHCDQRVQQIPSHRSHARVLQGSDESISSGRREGGPLHNSRHVGNTVQLEFEDDTEDSEDELEGYSNSDPRLRVHVEDLQRDSLWSASVAASTGTTRLSVQ
ncbi:hypothetical protein PINS_up004817 [Pythium insidiosum]|nr:hypothetical protein PINS_up004817 [Pythium insidiosum]